MSPIAESNGALVVVDMINSYEHEDGERCAQNAIDVVPRIQRVIAAARERDVAVIFVNDHYDLWTSERRRLIEMVLDRVADTSLVEPLLPDDDDPLLLKARHSIFYETSLEYLLRQTETRELTLVGQVTEQCILYSALDAYVRHFGVRVVADAVVAIEDELAEAALRMMKRNMHAELVSAEDAF